MAFFSLPPQVMVAFLSFATYVLALGFLHPTSSLRPLLFILMLGYIALNIAMLSPAKFTDSVYVNIAGCNVFGQALQYFDQVLLGKWSYDAQGPASGKGGQDPALGDSSAKSAGKKPLERQRSKKAAETGVLGRLYWGAAHAYNGRFLDTPWEVPNVPPFSRQDPSWVPSRGQYLRRRAVLFVVNLLVLDLLTRPKGTPEMDTAMFAAEKVGFFSRLGQVSVDEVMVRYFSSGMFYLVVYVFFQTAHTFMAIVMVGLGISEVKVWRPFIGSLWDAWSVRQFWGCFWHQSMRQMLSSPARFITYDVLRLRKGGFLGRYLFIFLTFLISGYLHQCGELATGLPFYESGVVRFFYTQTLGIIVEDGIQAAYRTITGGERDSKGDPRLWKRLIGILWMASFISWSLPVNSYPMIRREPGQGLLPFTIVGTFL